MDTVELDRRFAFHPPPHDGIAKAHGDVRMLLGACASDLNDMLPEGREKSMALTKLQEAMMCANAAIALDPSGVEESYQDVSRTNELHTGDEDAR